MSSEKYQHTSRMAFLSMSVTCLCACLLSSCRRVRAGLLSGFGPLRLGSWPSASLSVVGHDDHDEEGNVPLVCFLSGLRLLKKLTLPVGLLSLVAEVEPLPAEFATSVGDFVHESIGVDGSTSCSELLIERLRDTEGAADSLCSSPKSRHRVWQAVSDCSIMQAAPDI